MYQVIKPVPEFKPAEVLQAAETCVGIGVAKINGLLGEHALGVLQKQVNYGYDEVLSADCVIGDVPELLAIKELFSHSNNKSGIDFLISGCCFEPTSKDIVKSSHTDSYPSTCGITLLLPVIGSKAIFAASTEKFELSLDTFYDETTTSFPQYVTEYGPGDGLFLRQNITSLNGMPVDLQAIQHCGAADSFRKSVALDVITDSVTLSNS